ncbi:protein spinster homolog 1 [Daktulosphaira vitifoliae]|uniref:protein spinster homolog 1 n=1 Tax=Daktulosphaira vitifoliae TaxID=58002 RepID=UPI0021A9E7FF|nr:protein spinster homolog 1 [Daktulosphaira vitifoliae]XP_050540473.1 protein spinster homolog 1 [Daktulosphaira vitifoliae]XP_050540478.1 protein spinster homolog 1 [Daktulosphaira vitifoliae]XP_050540489.1 protein spinster homolog 1 [Daktulosphaira vitifoliae]
MNSYIKKLGFLYKSYVLTVLTLGYLTSEMGHFMIGVTSKATARDVHYGDIKCQLLEELAESSVFNYTLHGHCDMAPDQKSCESLTLDDGSKYCEWNYNGLGFEYQLLAGPAFIAVYSLCGIGFGIAADKFNRVRLLSLCTLISATAIGLIGAATQYWHLILLRILLAVGEAGTNPLSTGILSDLFSEEKRGLVMAIFNWGIYAGIGLAFPVGRYVTEMNVGGLSWRVPYYLSGMIGVIVAALAITTMKEPKRTVISEETEEVSNEVAKAGTDVNNTTNTTNNESTEKVSIWKVLFQPKILILCIAASIRHTGGFCFAYNADLFYRDIFPGYDMGWSLFVVTFLVGSIGVVVGGITSDSIVVKYGMRSRVAVLAISQLIATPFAYGSIYLGPLGAMVTLAISYLFAEMWFGILFAILVESVPMAVRSTTVGAFLFWMNNFGGNVPMFVEPVRKAYDYKTALAIFYAGFYLLSSIMFGLNIIFMGKKKQKKTNNHTLAGIENGGYKNTEFGTGAKGLPVSNFEHL